MIESISDIGCEPFPALKGKATSSPGTLGFITELINLAKLKVVFGNDKFPTGSTVYVRGDAYMGTRWAKDQMSVPVAEGTIKIIMVPVDQILLVDRG